MEHQQIDVRDFARARTIFDSEVLIAQRWQAANSLAVGYSRSRSPCASAHDHDSTQRRVRRLPDGERAFDRADGGATQE
jgi:hypothetical protein